MTRKEQLQFCKICHHQKFDRSKGIICGITSEIADFEESCMNFSTDRPDEIPKPDENKIVLDLTPHDLKNRAQERLDIHQSFGLAVAGGLLASLLGAIIWAYITISINFQIGYMAVALGFLVGYAVRFYGAGLDKKFGILGAALSFIGCLLGNYLSQVGFVANYQGISFLEVIHSIDFATSFLVMKESFSVIDLLFYGIAIYEGYYFSLRKVNTMLVTRFKIQGFKGNPTMHKLRKPLALASFLIFSIIVFIVVRGENTMKYYSYPSGRLMSKGMVKNSKNDGLWTYYAEDGYVQMEGYYEKGKANGQWKWYNERGQMTKKGNYKNGMEQGVWINYYPNGHKLDSCGYVNGRMQGAYKSYYENENVNQTGFYSRNEMDSLWTVYYLNGQINSQGYMKANEPNGPWKNYYEDGSLREEIFYHSETEIDVLNVWRKDGIQAVKDGNGQYLFLGPQGQILQTGEIADKKRTGVWKYYDVKGKLVQEGRFDNDEFFILNTWDQFGDQHVVNGYGTSKIFYPDGKTLAESGKVKNGRKVGKWKTYFPTSGNVQQEISYENGKLNGPQNVYYESGQIFVTGEMKDGNREGEWLWYFENGEISSQVSYSQDKKEGLQIIWSEWGIKTMEETYKEGKLLEETYF